MNQILGELESQVMKVVWGKGCCTAKDVLAALEGDKKHAYTTIGTILHRLCQKGLLTRMRQGRAFSYQPTIGQEEFAQRITRDILAGLLKDEERPILSTFIELLSEDKELLEELKDLLTLKA